MQGKHVVSDIQFESRLGTTKINIPVLYKELAISKVLDFLSHFDCFVILLS